MPCAQFRSTTLGGLRAAQEMPYSTLRASNAGNLGSAGAALQQCQWQLAILHTAQLMQCSTLHAIQSQPVWDCRNELS